jgi:TRAP-type uncharacterized transport system fused permease subunit
MIKEKSNQKDNEKKRLKVLYVLLAVYFIYDAFLIINDQFLLIPGAVPMFILGLLTIVLVIYAIGVVAIRYVVDRVKKRND